ncbi:gap junction protein alpha 9a [Chiloscyllium plagiosum]|uniref:gap junction protein alpha 9a n=1 Tax=Chiloscyllium plagiosum TaxID=36176 RepID=UPI001CB82B03|nr:gap junction protein alpha 9a [Chiloscyllium plagiosum]XP_043573753.1 gap junction protein alpha 9a [Chiloscyllium plagiosum]
MGDWNFLGGILEEVHVHSTIVGKIWLTILFIFRMLVLGVAAEDVWNDEQSEFICNTEQPGCRNVCYDKAFPISLIRYWVLQVIFVSSPSLVYMGHALYRLRALEKERQKKKVELKGELEETETMLEDRRRLERELRQLERRKLNKAPLRGSLLRTYVLHILTRSVVEVGFMMGQFLLYGLELDPLYKCKRLPCPNIVDCFVSRPTEKSVFMLFMLCISAVSLFLNILEIIHLGCKKTGLGLFGYYPKLKEEVGDIFIPKSQKNSSAQRISVSAVGHTHITVPSAPVGYSLLLEKPAEATMYPIFTPPELKPILNDQKQSYKETQHQPPAATQCHAGSSTALNCSEGPSGSEVPSQKGEECNEPSNAACLPAPSPHSASQTELSTAGTLYPTLHSAPFPAAISASASRTLRRVSATLSCAADSEAGHRRRCGFGVTRARTASKGDLKRPSRPDTPESICESSSESKHSGDGGSPQRALSPSRRMSLASNASGRRAPTDLQI